MPRSLTRRLHTAEDTAAILPRPNLAALRLALADAYPPPDAAADPLAWIGYELKVTAVQMRRGMRHTGRPDYALDLAFENRLTDLTRYTVSLCALAHRIERQSSGPGGVLDAFLAAVRERTHDTTNSERGGTPT